MSAGNAVTMRKTASVEFKVICCRRVSVCVSECMSVCLSVSVAIVIPMQGHRMRIRDEKSANLEYFWQPFATCYFWATCKLQMRNERI